MLHYVRRRKAEVRKSLRKATRAGGITLVLGAGVSIGRGLPSWSRLVRQLWEDLAPPRDLPDWLSHEHALPHPLAHQILLEEIEGATRWEIASARGCKADDVDPSLVRDKMVQKISDKLYGTSPNESDNDTLGILIALLKQEQKATDCRITRVITFNADDLLERGANRDTDAGREPVLYPVARASFHPRHGRCAFGRPAINVYHLHGFIPRSQRYGRGAQDTLVFTDAEYWESVANPASFANRVMENALQDTTCVFVGMSMTDVNMMRWLGLRFTEFTDDRNALYAYRGKTPAYAFKKTREAIGRHYWIAAAADDPTRFIASHLERRGVQTVALPTWGTPFKALMDECFERDEDSHPVATIHG